MKKYFPFSIKKCSNAATDFKSLSTFGRSGYVPTVFDSYKTTFTTGAKDSDDNKETTEDGTETTGKSGLVLVVVASLLLALSPMNVVCVCVVAITFFLSFFFFFFLIYFIICNIICHM